MSLLDKNISMDFILEMKEAFQLYDKSGDGFLDGKELGELMRSLGRNPTEDEIYKLMAEVDVDHNGKLDFEEFTILMNEKITEDPIELQGSNSIVINFGVNFDLNNKLNFDQRLLNYYGLSNTLYMFWVVILDISVTMKQNSQPLSSQNSTFCYK